MRYTCEKKMQQLISWFELPSRDFDRACGFYTTVLQKSIDKIDMGGLPMGFIMVNGQPGGSIVFSEDHEPSAN